MDTGTSIITADIKIKINLMYDNNYYGDPVHNHQLIIQGPQTIPQLPQLYLNLELGYQSLPIQK